jgi:mannose-6-phosphate isomerase-like protein (cupin superfamily)
MVEVISKPWGWEFTLLETASVLVTYLHIRKGSSTSLHCHPKKRTGYVVLQGSVEVEFLSNKRTLVAGEKINFRAGLFHKTHALSQDCIILEFESPPNKHDLLRMEDSFGRTGSAYESQPAPISDDLYRQYQSYTDKLSSDCVGKSIIKVSNFSLSRKRVSIPELLESDNLETIVCLLDDAIHANEKYLSEEPGVIVNSGDVTSIDILGRMESILSLGGIYDLLIIKKVNSEFTI